MNKVKIIADSTCDLSSELLERYDISVVPLYVVFGDESFKDGVEITTEDLYKRVDRDGVLPKTSAPSPADFIRVFKPIVEAGDDIVYIGLSSHLSSTIQNAKLASMEFPEGRIEIVDSENLSTGIGILVLKAADLAAEGLGSKEIAERISSYRSKVKMRFAINTLEYLHKGGRCSAMQSFVGGILKIRPIVAVTEGKMIVEEKLRGKIEKVLTEMLEKVHADAGNMDDARAIIVHSMAPEYAELLRKELEGRLKVKELLMTDAGCVISSHCGPLTTGFVYLTK